MENNQLLLKQRMLIGFRIAKRRIELGLSQEALGAAIGRNKDSISRYERGKTIIAAEMMALLACKLQCPVDYFYDDNLYENEEDEKETINILLNNLMQIRPKSLRNMILNNLRISSFYNNS